MKLINKIILLFFIIAPISFTQINIDSLEYVPLIKPYNLLSTRLNKQLNTYYLFSNFIFNEDYKNIWLKVSENYNSTLIRSADKSIRDEHYFSASSAYKFSDVFHAGFLASNSILSDSRRIEINQASTSIFSFFTEINPEKNIFLIPFVGYTNNRQIGENDYGYVYGGEASAENYTLSDFILSSELRLKNEDISPRKNAIRYLNFLAGNNFSNRVNNALNIRYSLNRKDFYFTADTATSQRFNITNNIQSRIETNYLLQDRLQYNNFLDLFYLDIIGKISYRNIERDTRYKLVENPTSSIFDTRIDELRLEFESAASYSSDFFNGTLRILYSERDEKHITKNIEGINSIFYDQRSRQENIKNNGSLRASLSFSGSFNFSRTNKIFLSFFQNKLRYDTPSEDNFDDRDELLTIARIRYTKELSPFFQAFINAEGTFNHTVYVFSEKSSNNNINRIIKLSSGGNYSGKNLTSFNSFEVSANYTVYDFEDLNPNFRSFTFRQFTATDSTDIKFSGKISLNIFGYLKLSEQGDLKWASFSTKPTRFLEEIYAEPKLRLKISRFSFASGIRYFLLNTYNFNEREKEIESRYNSIGPVSEIIYYLNDELFIKFYGWYEFIKINDDNRKDQVNISFEMNYNF